MTEPFEVVLAGAKIWNSGLELTNSDWPWAREAIIGSRSDRRMHIVYLLYRKVEQP